jgi:hypothetical protein
MQVGQGLGVVEPTALGHEAVEKLQDAVRSINEAV